MALLFTTDSNFWVKKCKLWLVGIIEREIALTDTTIGAAAADAAVAAAEVRGTSAKQKHRDSGLLTFAYKLNIGGCCGCCCNCRKQVREFSQTHPIPSDRPV